jgi:hypothetical protein
MYSASTKKPSSTQLRLMNIATLLTNIPRPPTLNREMPTRLEAWPNFQPYPEPFNSGRGFTIRFRTMNRQEPINIDPILRAEISIMVSLAIIAHLPAMTVNAYHPYQFVVHPWNPGCRSFIT